MQENFEFLFLTPKLFTKISKFNFVSKIKFDEKQNTNKPSKQVDHYLLGTTYFHLCKCFTIFSIKITFTNKYRGFQTFPLYSSKLLVINKAF